MFDIAVETALLLALAAFFAGFMDAIAGGGGLVTVPALLLAGFGPVESIATNKLQSIFGTASSVIAYSAKGHVDLKAQIPWACLSFIAGVGGALMASFLPGEFLEAILPVLLIGVAIFFAVRPRVDDIDRARRISPFLFGIAIVPVIGFYDGAFGPGAGSFFMLAFVALAGFGILKATAHTKLLNFASNFGGFVAFAFLGVVYWKIGLLMGVAQFAGARLGAALAMKKGAAVIKPLLIVVCLALALRLLTQEDNPLLTFLGF
ncbi:TSUP family transporter [Chelativorans sp. YIM 93263]|uniref:TSUP family transporter n=1 Tax=Chelativorans sp. YIM 93263 TaxID=2906648 RepID=UPI0023797E4A|nr:TSUP family transporter [Chelativorans sp. YIM 93263]